MRTFAQKPKAAGQTASVKATPASPALAGPGRAAVSAEPPSASSAAASPVGHDFSRVPVRSGTPPPPGSLPRNTTGIEGEPPGLGAWARTLFRAPQTRPGDAAERSAERAAADGTPPRASASAAPDAVTPPWGAGRRLTRDERRWHEPRAGADLGDVRVHEGAIPGRWARVLGARAFTIGRDVVVGAGEYAAGTDAGRRLMAHELAHVAMGWGHAPLLARVSLTAADFDFLADSIHDAVAKSGDEELIYVALQKLERDAAAITSLKTAYKTRHSAELLTDLKTRLKGRGLELAKTLLGEKSTLKMAAAAPSTPAEFAAMAKAINTALTAKTPDAEGVYAQLITLGRSAANSTSLKSAYKTKFSKDLEADLKALSGADLSYALYLLNAPGPAGPHTDADLKAQPGPGTPPATTPPAAAGGTVSVGTRVPYETTSGKKATYTFGVGYSGALSSESRWLQFIERQIEYVPKDGGKAVSLDKEVTSGGGKNKYRLTTDASKPNWVVDSFSATDPFFDSKSTTFRDATSVTIYDSPAPREGDIKEAFDKGATSVTSRAHFDIYLIRDFSAIYHVEIEVVWTYTAPKTGTVNRNVKDAKAVSGLPGPLHTALVAKYPAFAYIR